MGKKPQANQKNYIVCLIVCLLLLAGELLINAYYGHQNAELSQKIAKVTVPKKETMPVTVSDVKAKSLTKQVKQNLDDLLDGQLTVTNQTALNKLTGIFLQTGKAVPTLKQTVQQRHAYFKGFRYTLDSTGAIKLQGGYHLVGHLTSEYKGQPTESNESIVDFGLDKAGKINSVATYTVQPGGEN